MTWQELRRLAEQYREIEKSPVAQKEDDFHALLAMDHDKLTHLAYEALELLEKLDADLGYEICMLDHIEGSSADTACGYVVSQCDIDGGYRKFVKNLGGYTPENGPSGDALVFGNWKDAKAAIAHIDPEIAKSFRIYPVVLMAGKEPRTTMPRSEQ